MFREEVAACAVNVGKVRMICKYNLTGEARDEALALLDEVEDILTRPSELSEDGQRAKWRKDKAEWRANRVSQKKNGRPKKSKNVRGQSEDKSADTVGVEEVEVEGVAVEDAGYVDVAERVRRDGLKRFSDARGRT
jgi:hypothetical protein